MKTKKLLKSLFLSLVAIAFFSCGGSDDGGAVSGGGPTPTVTSISLSSPVATSILVGTTVNFSVVDNLGNNLTSTATYTANGDAISSSYTFTTSGSYAIVAKSTTFTSNTVTIVVTDPPVATSINLTFNPDTPTTADMVNFVVMDDLGNDVSSSSTFKISSVDVTSPYRFSAIGDYTVEANYVDGSNTLTTSESITVVRGFTKKALLEDFTGTWCPNCPPAASAVSNAIAVNSNVFGVGYHDGQSSYPDPMEIPETVYWSSYYNVTGFPTVYVNGPDTRWDFPGMGQINTELAETATLGLGVSASITGGMLDIDVKVAFSTVPSEEVKLMVYLIEDNVTTSSPQAGSSQGAAYVHRDVLREVYTDQLGDVIPSGSISTTADYTKSFTGLTLPSNIDNVDNLKVIAYVRNTYVKTFTDYFGDVHTDSPHYDIYNVQEVTMGGDQDFD